MEIPTNFTAFKTKSAKAIKEIRTAVKQRDWSWLAAFALYSIFAVATAALILFSSVITGLEKFGVLQENIYAPKKELIYALKNQEQNDKGQYLTIYTLTFKTPEGQGGGVSYFKYPNGCDNEHLVPLDSRGMEFKNGATYAVAAYDVSCVTDKPILDTKALFKLK